jgi:hypothetical protein
VNVHQREHWRLPLLGEVDAAAMATLPAMVAAAFDGVERLPEPPATAVSAAATPLTLIVRFSCAVAAFEHLVPRRHTDPIGNGEHCALHLWPENDPTHRLTFRVAPHGARDATQTRRGQGETVLSGAPDVWEEQQTVTGPWHVYHGYTDDGWQAEFVIPWQTLGLTAPPPTIGLAVERIYLTGREWPAQREQRWPAHAPQDALLDGAEVAVGNAGIPLAVDLGTLVFGENEAVLDLGDDWPARPDSLAIEVRDSEGGVADCQTIAVAEERVSLGFRLERALSHYAAPLAPARLLLRLSRGDQALYQLLLPVDRHHGVPVCERYSDPAGAATDTSAEARLRRVIAALPRLVRRTTRDGAPSDFCLVADREQLTVNLMAETAWDQLAQIVLSRFATVEDRLIAAMALVGQRSVTTLMGQTVFFDARGQHTYHTPLHEVMEPLSLLRWGGGTAAARACVLAELVRRLGAASGRPLATRVVMLDADGGPRRAARRYAGCNNLAPAVAEPQAVAAVAVDYRGSQTVLDPNALLFCPAPGGGERLATVEEIVGSPETAAVAGRLTRAYAGLDIGELRRYPVNTPLSRGLFPELAADPDGGRTACSRGYLQRPPAVSAGRRQHDGAPAAMLRTAGGEPGVRDGDVRVSVAEDAFVVEVRVTGVDLAAFSDRDRAAERVHVTVDPTHGHQTFLHCSAALDGARCAAFEAASGIQTLFRHLSTENHRVTDDVADDAWSLTMPQSPAAYAMVFRLPWQLLRLAANALPPVLGINVWVAGRRPTYEQVFLARPLWRLPACPFAFADAYLTPPQVLLAGIDFGTPVWGENCGHATLRNATDRDVDVTLQAVTRGGMERFRIDSAAAAVTVPAGATAHTPFAFWADPREKMTSGCAQTLTLTARHAERLLFAADWPLSYCGTPSVYQRFEPSAEYARPKPDDPWFVQRLLDWAAAQLPALRRQTTLDGAASDFVIASSDGSVVFDLMTDGVCADMARLIEQTFATDLDRIVGMVALAQHPEVLRHMSFGHRLMVQASGLSILRGNHAGGGGNCGLHSRAAAAMLAELEIAGAPLLAHTQGIWGHAINGVRWGEGKALVDTDVGHLFLTADGRDLATIEQLQAGGPLLTSAGTGEIGRYRACWRAYAEGMPRTDDALYPGTFPSWSGTDGSYLAPGRPDAPAYGRVTVTPSQ